MASYPVTHGYTINIVKDKSKPAYILLNPQAKLAAESSTHEHLAEQASTYKQVRTSDDNGSPSDIIYNPDHINEVAHEEVVEDAGDPGDLSGVQCDLCNTRLMGQGEARRHMVSIHNMLTFEGPCFKCDFCNIFVTDRVSHMKAAHYSPLAQAFAKRDNSYQCRQCDYSSDQLTNIRNHVDAKHGTGENKYVCEECNSQYKTLNSMRAHKSRVHVKRRRSSLGDVDKVKVRRKQSQSDIKEQILALELKTLPGLVNGKSNRTKFVVL